jgi:hypothetical protein
MYATRAPRPQQQRPQSANRRGLSQSKSFGFLDAVPQFLLQNLLGGVLREQEVVEAGVRRGEAVVVISVPRDHKVHVTQAVDGRSVATRGAQSQGAEGRGGGKRIFAPARHELQEFPLLALSKGMQNFPKRGNDFFAAIVAVLVPISEGGGCKTSRQDCQTECHSARQRNPAQGSRR